MAKEGYSRHDDLPQQHENPRIQWSWDEEEAKDASLRRAADVVVNHNESKDDSRESNGTLVCQLCCIPAGGEPL